MGGFRRFVIAIAGFFQVLSILVTTVAGAILGKELAKLVVAMDRSYTRVLLANNDIGTMPEVMGLVLGGVTGFVMAATAAAVLFALMEIARNTRTLVTREALLSPSHKAEPRF